jgi:hypothetical protein
MSYVRLIPTNLDHHCESHGGWRVGLNRGPPPTIYVELSLSYGDVIA